MAAFATAADIVVDPGGSLHEALRQAREWRRTGDARCIGGINIIVKPGRYYMSEPLFLRPEDSGTASSPLTIRGEEGAETIICGDPRQQHTQLWPREGMERIIGFDAEKRTITIPTPPKKKLSTLTAHLPSVEMVVHQRWAIAILRVKDMAVLGDSTVVTFREPESRLEFEHPWPQPVIDKASPQPPPKVGERKGNSSFLLRTTEQHDGVERLVVIDGASHVYIRNITFEHTCWNRPLHRGHVTLQGGFPIVDAYKLKEHEGLPWDAGLENQAWIERPVSAVSVSHAHDVEFCKCTFRRLGSTALDFIDETEDCTIWSSTFEDIGGTAIMAGSFAESPREVHRPYTDLAKRCKGLRIHYNSISRVGQEDWGAVAIGCGYVCNVEIMHNTVTDCPYSGICVGWGWTPHDTGMEQNIIENNQVSCYATCLYDAGGIYTLSNQPGSVIRDNIISQPFPAPYATNDRAFCIYLDARTDGFTVFNNKTVDSDTLPHRRMSIYNEGLRPIRRDEIGDNQPGPNLILFPKIESEPDSHLIF